MGEGQVEGGVTRTSWEQGLGTPDLQQPGSQGGREGGGRASFSTSPAVSTAGEGNPGILGVSLGKSKTPTLPFPPGCSTSASLVAPAERRGIPHQPRTRLLPKSTGKCLFSRTGFLQWAARWRPERRVCALTPCPPDVSVNLFGTRVFADVIK